jgi:CHAT domain-containing protein
MRSTFRLGGAETLTVADLVEQELARLELVVAPACQSGSGGPDAPDELLGVAHMLAHVGARHVVASLWDADDAATALVVALVYRALADGEVPHRALQGAQRWVASASGPALAEVARRRLADDGDAAWLPYDLAIEFLALSAHPDHRSGDEPVFGHPALWGALSCLDA